MKKNPSLFSSPCGFTLVELLVVIVIIATLAAVSFTLGPKMMRKGDAAKSVQNMRQIGSMLGTYAVDNNSTLPAPRGQSSHDPTTTITKTHWFENLMIMAYPDTDPAKMNKEWWENNKPFLRNPLCTAKTKPWPWDTWNPGYAMNLQIAIQLGIPDTWEDNGQGARSYPVPLHRVSDPARTPIVAQRGDWHFYFNPEQLKDPNLKEFLVDNKMPILFVDGHVESMTLQEYGDRQLYLAPTFKAK